MRFTDNALARILTENYADRSKRLPPLMGYAIAFIPSQ